MNTAQTTAAAVPEIRIKDLEAGALFTFATGAAGKVYRRTGESDGGFPQAEEITSGDVITAPDACPVVRVSEAAAVPDMSHIRTGTDLTEEAIAFLARLLAVDLTMAVLAAEDSLRQRLVTRDGDGAAISEALEIVRRQIANQCDTLAAHLSGEVDQSVAEETGDPIPPARLLRIKDLEAGAFFTFADLDEARVYQRRAEWDGPFPTAEEVRTGRVVTAADSCLVRRVPATQAEDLRAAIRMARRYFDPARAAEDGFLFMLAGRRAETYTANGESTGAHRDGYSPCAVCGKAIRDDDKRAGSVWLHGGGAYLVKPGAGYENLPLDPAADLGRYKIGASCLRRYPELRAFTY
jgi:hypothetical protein